MKSQDLSFATCSYMYMQYFSKKNVLIASSAYINSPVAFSVVSYKTRLLVYLTLTFDSKVSNHCDKYDHLGQKMKEEFKCYEQNQPMDKQKDKQMRPITIYHTFF